MNDPAVKAAEQLAWEMTSWKSIDISTEEIFQSNDSTPDGMSPATRSSHHYIETAAGQRMSEERLILADGKETFRIAFKDGERAAILDRFAINGKELESVQIQRGFPAEAEYGWYNCPEPLRSFYCGLTPLHEALANARHLGTSRHLDRECNDFLIQRSAGTDPIQLTFSLDKSTSIPLNVITYKSDKERLDGRQLAVWSAKSFDEVSGRHISLESEHVIYAMTGPLKPEVIRKIKVSGLHYDREYPRSTFWPKISPETQVIDRVTGKVTHGQRA